jgi:hypothetical protein
MRWDSLLNFGCRSAHDTDARPGGTLYGTDAWGRVSIVSNMNIHPQMVCPGLAKAPTADCAVLPRTESTRNKPKRTHHAPPDAAEVAFEQRGLAGTSLQEVVGTAGRTRGEVVWALSRQAAAAGQLDGLAPP